MSLRWIVSLALCASPLFAANQISWVASFGADSGACGLRTAPCRTFAGAIPNTVAGGMVKAVDSADYSLNGAQLTIQTSVTIDGSGTGASFIGAGNAFVVQAGAVTIRDLIINVPANSTAINISGADVNIENTTITGAPGYALGISLVGGTLFADHLSIVGAGSAVQITGGKATFRNSVLRGNTVGILAIALSGTATVMIDRSQLSLNQVGVLADGVSRPNGGCTIRVSNSLITSNGSALRQDRGGQVLSYGNNVIDDNTDDGSSPVLATLK